MLADRQPVNKHNDLNIERELWIEARGRKDKARLRIDRIELQADGRWLCRWSIEYLCQAGAAFGSDPVDALIMCLKIIGGLIHRTNADGVVVWWKRPGDNGGFPIPDDAAKA